LRHDAKPEPVHLLRESLGRFGISYGWTLFMVIQTGTIAALPWRSQIPGVFFPSVSTSTAWHIWKVPPIPVGPWCWGIWTSGQHGEPDGHCVIFFLAIVNILACGWIADSGRVSSQRRSRWR